GAARAAVRQRLRSQPRGAADAAGRRGRVRAGPAQPRQPDRRRAPGRLPPAPLSARRCGGRAAPAARRARRRGDAGDRWRVQHGRRHRPAARTGDRGTRAAGAAVCGRCARRRRAGARGSRFGGGGRPGRGHGAAAPGHARQGAGQLRRGGGRRRRPGRPPGRNRASLPLHHRHAAGAGGRGAGGGQAGAARALASRAPARAGAALPRDRQPPRPGAAGVRDPDPAGAVRRQRTRAGDGRIAGAGRLLGRRDPSADRARGPGAAARGFQRRPRTGAGRGAGRCAGPGPRSRRRRRQPNGMTGADANGRVALAAIGLALLSALFFTMTYVLNRASASGGGHWAWLACLRYLITLPLMLPLLARRGAMAPVLRAIATHPWAWLRCAGIGFVLFYVLLSYAAASGPSWLVAGSFQFTVIAGMLCAPLLYRDARRRIPPAGLAVAGLILAGVLLMQFGHASGALDRAAWIALACVLVSAVAYPLGNRLLLLHLERSGESLDATQRVFGMTLASQPMWLLLAAYAALQAGA